MSMYGTFVDISKLDTIDEESSTEVRLITVESAFMAHSLHRTSPIQWETCIQV